MADEKPAKKPRKFKVPVVQEKTLEELRSEDAEKRASALTDILGETLPQIPSSFQYRLGDADRVKNSFEFVYMLIGGTPAFALWAAQNKGEFYKIWAKMVPAANNVLNTTGNVIIQTGVPESPLNNPAPRQTIDAEIIDDGMDDE